MLKIKLLRLMPLMSAIAIVGLSASPLAVSAADVSSQISVAGTVVLAFPTGARGVGIANACNGPAAAPFTVITSLWAGLPSGSTSDVNVTVTFYTEMSNPATGFAQGRISAPGHATQYFTWTRSGVTALITFESTSTSCSGLTDGAALGNFVPEGVTGPLTAFVVADGQILG